MCLDAIRNIIKSGEKESRFIVLCVLLALLFSGAAYAFFLGNSLRYWDEEHYLLLAQNLHKGIYSFNGINSTAFQPPGYPLILYILSLASSNLVFLRFANFIFLCLSIVTLYWMLQKEEGALAAILGVLIAAAYPLFFYTSGTFYPQMAASAFFMGALALILSLAQPHWQRELALGGVLGFLCLIVPSFLLYLPLWMAYPWFVRNKMRLRASILLLLACFTVIGVWTTRNAVAFERFVLISSNGGINLLLGNSSKTAPRAGVNTNLDKFLALGEKMNEFEQDKYYEREALKWITENPRQALQLYAMKSLNFFNFKNELASKSEESWLKDALSFLSYYPLLILALARIAWSFKHPLKPFECYLFLFLLASPFLQGIFFTRIRFRIPFDFLLIYFAASCIRLLLARMHYDKTSDSQSISVEKR